MSLSELGSLVFSPWFSVSIIIYAATRVITYFNKNEKPIIIKLCIFLGIASLPVSLPMFLIDSAFESRNSKQKQEYEKTAFYLMKKIRYIAECTEKPSDRYIHEFNLACDHEIFLHKDGSFNLSYWKYREFENLGFYRSEWDSFNSMFPDYYRD